MQKVWSLSGLLLVSGSGLRKEKAGSDRRLGAGAYLSLLLAMLFFSGLAANVTLTKALPSQAWADAISAFDFKTLNGHFGTALSKTTASDGAAGKTAATTTFRGSGGVGAADGFLFALGLIPTVMFALGMVAVFEHFGALEAAKRLLTPLLRPLLGIPGVAGLTVISSLQSTDAGGVMTRALADEGSITEAEKDIFAMFQFSAGATLTNFFSSGAILFTLRSPDGEPAVTASVGLCILVMLIMKIAGANLMRLYCRHIERKNGQVAAG